MTLTLEQIIQLQVFQVETLHQLPAVYLLGDAKIVILLFLRFHNLVS